MKCFSNPESDCTGGSSTIKLVYNHFIDDFYHGKFDIEGKFHFRTDFSAGGFRHIPEGLGLRDGARSIQHHHVSLETSLSTCGQHALHIFHHFSWPRFERVMNLKIHHEMLMCPWFRCDRWIKHPRFGLERPPRRLPPWEIEDRRAPIIVEEWLVGRATVEVAMSTSTYHE